MKKVYTLIIAFFLLAGCAHDHPVQHLPSGEISNQIQALMNEQESSWNSGDIDGFMKHYWQNDSLKFVGKRGLTYGWQQTLDNYKKGYPDAAAMGNLKFNNIAVDVLSDSSAFVIGKWTLFRVSDTISGHYTLLWKKLNNNWVIITDHSS